ncbi:DUF3108 domain-containing protein [Luteimonas granuli]|uniref:DUF3108 domain-containing protein n=1 Tax=Luteimonas granuli TaxID=1176533 RepID=A0A518N2T6_9GAMM|nr:DUF3108 domain-containing protein [Luteimonas granuli]QDW66218.1 DUF3108 domain-containing protein [Luteimonas granuli]
MRAVHTFLLTVLATVSTATAAASVQADSGIREPAAALQPFLATYDAWNGGRPAGAATMRLAREDGHWLLGLDVTGNRGLARWVRLDIDQDTVFDVVGDQYRPLRQSTRRKALFVDREVEGVYDWAAGSARWEGDIKAARRQPVALREGDMGGLLINLAIVRDAAPGRRLGYRFVDGGRVREHEYAVAEATEKVEVDGLSWEALRVSRTNGGDDETILWVARGVPTPVRILQREDGEDGIDLRLVAYEGVH